MGAGSVVGSAPDRKDGELMPRCKLTEPGRLTIEDHTLGRFVRIVFDHYTDVSDELAVYLKASVDAERLEFEGEAQPKAKASEPEAAEPKPKAEKATKAPRTKPARRWGKK